MPQPLFGRVAVRKIFKRKIVNSQNMFYFGRNRGKIQIRRKKDINRNIFFLLVRDEPINFWLPKESRGKMKYFVWVSRMNILNIRKRPRGQDVGNRTSRVGKQNIRVYVITSKKRGQQPKGVFRNPGPFMGKKTADINADLHIATRQGRTGEGRAVTLHSGLPRTAVCDV